MPFAGDRNMFGRQTPLLAQVLVIHEDLRRVQQYPFDYAILFFKGHEILSPSGPYRIWERESCRKSAVLDSL